MKERRSKVRLKAENRIERILNLAENEILNTGLTGFRLETIIPLSGCSRGTFYSTITCKEDLFAKLAIKGINLWLNLISKARQFKGSSREKLLAIHVSHILFIKQHPVLYESLYIANLNMTRVMLDAQTVAILDERIGMLLTHLEECADEGVAAKELMLPDDITTKDLALLMWSTQYGVMVMSMRDKPNASEISLKHKHYLRHVYDKMPWHPTSDKHNYDETTQRILKEVFAEEMKQVKDLNIAFN